MTRGISKMAVFSVLPVFPGFAEIRHFGDLGSLGIWGPGSRILGSGILDPGSWILDPGSWILDSGSGIRNPEILDLGILGEIPKSQGSRDLWNLSASEYPVP